MQLDPRFVKVAHDPGDPVLCSHCPFCGSGQITGRSDGGIDCAFCGQSFIVRVQPAFPGMPQAPGMGAPTDVGPDMGAMPPPGMDEGGGMPPGMEDEGMPPGAGDEGMPPGEEGEEGGEPGEEEEEEGGQEGEEEGPPFPPKKKAASLAATGAVRGDPAYTGHYNRGWKASAGGGGNGALDRADFRDEPDAWYDGYHDYAADRPKYHSRECRADDHDAPGCSLWDEPPKTARRYRTLAGDELDEARYIRHLAILHSGMSPIVIRLVRHESAAS